MKIKQISLLLCISLVTCLSIQTVTKKIYSLPNDRKIIIEKGDITKSNVDVIVNAANEQLAGGAGVCGAIFKEAGWEKLQESCNKYPEKNSVRCATGQVAVTPSFNLEPHGIKYIIHAVGPDCRIIKNETQQNNLLKKTYENSMHEAEKLPVKSIAFPFISSAIYAFPKKRAARIAVDSVHQYLQKHQNSKLKAVHFTLFSEQDFDLFAQILDTIL